MTIPITVVGSTSTAGTGSLSVIFTGGAGSLSTSFKLYSRIPYSLQNGADWEWGLGTCLPGNVLARTQVNAKRVSGVLTEGGTSAISLSGTTQVVLQVTETNWDGFAQETNLATELAQLSEGFHIILLVGESHIFGRGVADALVETQDARVQQYGCASGDARYQTVFSGTYPLHHLAGVNTGYFGPETTFAKAYLAQHPTVPGVILMPLGYGSTKVVQGDAPYWNPGNAEISATGGAGTQAAINLTNSALSVAKTQFPLSAVVGMLVHVGANDGANYTPAEVFKRELHTLVYALRSQITGASAAWCILFGMPPEAVADNPTTTYAGIDAAIAAMPTDVGLCSYVPGVSGVTTDRIHYNAAGCRLVGNLASTALKTLTAQKTGLPSASDATKVVRMQSVVTSSAKLAESGDSANWIYTSLAGSQLLAERAGVSQKYLPAAQDGYFQWPLPPETANTSSLLVGITEHFIEKAYSTPGYLFYSMMTSTSTGKYRVGPGGVPVDTTVSYQAGDLVRIRRAGTSIFFEVARAATPTVWITLQEYTGVVQKRWFLHASFYGPLTLGNILVSRGF